MTNKWSSSKVSLAVIVLVLMFLGGWFGVGLMHSTTSSLQSSSRTAVAKSKAELDQAISQVSQVQTVAGHSLNMLGDGELLSKSRNNEYYKNLLDENRSNIDDLFERIGSNLNYDDDDWCLVSQLTPEDQSLARQIQKDWREDQEISYDSKVLYVSYSEATLSELADSGDVVAMSVLAQYKFSEHTHGDLDKFLKFQLDNAQMSAAFGGYETYIHAAIWYRQLSQKVLDLGDYETSKSILFDVLAITKLAFESGQNAALFLSAGMAKDYQDRYGFDDDIFTRMTERVNEFKTQVQKKRVDIGVAGQEIPIAVEKQGSYLLFNELLEEDNLWFQYMANENTCFDAHRELHVLMAERSAIKAERDAE